MLKHHTPAARLNAENEYLAELVDCLRLIPQVQRVLIDTSAEELCTWVVIDAQPFDRDSRNAIYHAELAVAHRHPDVAAGLRLLNLTEYGSQQMTDLLPADAESVLAR
ncbi:MAG: hypothetical protein ACYDCQ_05015 [Dehalococcoidia bacterium]